MIVKAEVIEKDSMVGMVEFQKMFERTSSSVRSRFDIMDLHW